MPTEPQKIDLLAKARTLLIEMPRRRLMPLSDCEIELLRQLADEIERLRQQVKQMAQRNHLKIEDGASERLQVHRHRPNGMLTRGPRFSPIEKRLKGLMEVLDDEQHKPTNS